MATQNKLDPKAAPTPANYAQYVTERNARTADVMAKQQRISGQQIRLQNLSMRMLYDAGYTLDVLSDTMVR